jgi:hypothetical protein
MPIQPSPTTQPTHTSRPREGRRRPIAIAAALPAALRAAISALTPAAITVAISVVVPLLAAGTAHAAPAPAAAGTASPAFPGGATEPTGTTGSIGAVISPTGPLRGGSAATRDLATARLDAGSTAAQVPPPPLQPAPPPEPQTPSYPSENDIVPPAAPAPAAPDGTGAPGAATPGSSTCGLWDLGACVNDWLRGAIRDALNPGLELLSGTLLTTPTLEQMPRVEELWSRSWHILLACYATLIMAAGVLLMAHESLQTRYSLRELLPRVIVGFFAGALSLVFAGMAIDVANALSVSVMSGGTDPEDGAAVLADLILGVVTNDGGLFLLLAGVVVVVMLIALLLVYVVRVAFTVLLIAGAPLALMMHALPQTEGIAAWWWRAFGGVLAIQVLQSLVLATAVRVLLNDDGAFATTMFGASTTTSSGWINLLVSITLLWILWKIPFWVLGSISGRRGRSLIGSALRTYLMFKTFGLARAAAGGLRGRSANTSAGKTRGGAGGDDPYPGERATPDGQLMLPLAGVRRARRHLTPAPGWPAITRSGQGSGGRASGSGGSGVGCQLALPLTEGDWPENRPRLGRDGQYRLPLPVTRVPRPAPQPTETPGDRQPRPAGAGVQLGLPLAEGDWPENRPRLGRDGQYRLPLPVTRVPRPRRTPPPPPPPTRRAGEGRQQAFPFHDPQPWVFDGNRPLRSGQYPLPLPGLTRHPRASAPTPPPSPPAPPAGPPPQQLLLPLDVPAPSATPPASPPPATAPPATARHAGTRRAGARRASGPPAAAPRPDTTPPDEAAPSGWRSATAPDAPRSAAEPDTSHAPRRPRNRRRRSS